MKQKLKNIQDKFMSQIQNTGNLAEAYAYIPIFGWIYACYFRKENKMSKFHGEQSMWLNITLMVVYFCVWVLEKFPITSFLFGTHAIFNPIIRTVWIVFLLLYLWASVFGAYKAYNMEMWEIPYLKEISSKMKEFLDKLKNK